MFEIYINPDNGKKYEVDAESKEQFFIDFPNAVLFEEQIEEPVVEEAPQEISQDFNVYQDVRTKKQFEVDIDQTDKFLQDFPEAELIKGPGKQTPSTQDAGAGVKKASDTDLALDDGLSELREDDGEWDWGVVDYFSDLYRAGKEGWSQGKLADDAFDVINKGADVESKDILKFLKKQKEVGEKNVGSDEMRDWQKTYNENGKSTWGAIKGIMQNPTVLSTLLVSSISSQLSAIVNSGEVLAAGAAGAATGAGTGAALGAVGGPLASITAAGGALTGAMVGTMAAMETGLTFGELLQEAVGDDLNEGAIKEFLNDPERLTDLKNKALKRGLTIGAIEGLTMGLAKGVGGKLAKAGFKKLAIGATTGVIEAGGGSLGEIGGRYVAGQEMDAGEIIFEGVAGLGGAPLTIASQATKLGKAIDKASINKIIKDTDYKNVTDAFKTADVGDAEINIAKIKNSTKIVDEQVDSKVISSELTEEEGIEIKNNFRKTQQAVNKISSLNFLKKDEINAVNLLKEKETLENKIKEVGDASLTSIESKRVEDINNSLTNIRVNTNLEATEGLAKELGFKEKVKTLKTTNGWIAAVAKETGLSIEEATKQLKDVSGVFIGDGRIFIDKEQAIKMESVSVGSHEILHPILNALIGDKSAQGAIVKDFKKSMTSKQIAYVDNFLKDNEIAPDQWDTEFLNVFSDGIIKNKIDYDKTTFEKLKDVITRLFRGQGFENISFDSGRDVFNFLKEYNTSIKETGKVSGVAVEAIKKAETTKGVKVKDAKTVDLQKSTEKKQKLTAEEDKTLANTVLEIKDLKKQNEEAAKKFGKEPIKSAKESRLEGEVLNKLKPTIDSFVEKRTKDLYDKIPQEAKKGITRQDFKESMTSDIATMVFEEYTQKQPLEKFIVNRGFLRSNDLAKRLGIESAEQGITRSLDATTQDGGGIQIEAQDTSQAIAEEATAEKETKSKLIKAETLLGSPAAIEMAKNEAISKIDKVPQGKLTFKNLEGLVAETFSRQLAIQVKKITDPKANLASMEMKFAQMFLQKNAKQLIKLLPEGAVLEAASENLLGTSTGVSNNILNNSNLYTKQERTTKKAGISPYVKNKDIKVEDFLEAIGIVDNKPVKGISPRDKTGQTIKGFLRLTEKLMSNSFARQILSETPGTENVVQDIAGGKSVFQFSKNVKNKSKKVKINSKAKENIKLGLEKLKTISNNDDVYNSFIDSVINNINNVDSLSDVIDVIFNAPKPLMSLRAYRELTAKLVVVVNKSLDKTIPSASNLVYKLINETKKFFKYQQQIVGFEYAQEDLINTIANAPDKESKAQAIKEFLIYAGRSIRSLKIDGIRTNELLFNKIIKNISENNKLNFNLEVKTEQLEGDNKPIKRTYITLDGVTVSGLTNIEAIKENWPGNKSAIDLQAESTISYLKKLIDRAKANGTIDQVIGMLTLLTADQRSAIRKVSKAGYEIKALGNEKSILEHETSADTIFKAFVEYAKTNDLKALDAVLEKAKVNLIPVPLDKILNEKGIKETDIARYSRPEFVDAANKYTGENKSNWQSSKEFEKGALQGLNKDFNNIIEENTGVTAKSIYSRAKAEAAGSSKGRILFGIPYSAQDFVGLLYRMLGKGKIGDNQMAWFKKNLLDPYAVAMNAISNERIKLAKEYKALVKSLKIVPKDLRKKLPGEPYTQEMAVRVYIWNKQGMKIPDIDQTDIDTLVKFVVDNQDLRDFSNSLININGVDGYVGPDKNWIAGTIDTDLIGGLNTTKRAKHLAEWQENADAIFTKENLNKLEALYGTKYRVAMENILARMKSGKNRPPGGDQLTNRFTDWISNAVGSIMFLNTRSAVLQTISAINFLNFSDNNVLSAGKAFANQKQFWKDFMSLMNSDFLVDRRNGLRINVNEADVAELAATSKNKAKAAISIMLKAGFLPTQIADSFAIASGGSAFYRNRINTYENQGLTAKEAEVKAMQDFRETAEESQQSSRPDKISQQQAGPLGRIVLAFANTPAQYARIIDKAIKDLKTGRGDRKTNISKIIYYGVAQNLLFSALQSALFAAAFNDEDEDEQNEKNIRIANGMLDSLLRGTGLAGSVLSVAKNAALRIVKESKKKGPKYEEAALELLRISPPISSKISKIRSAGRAISWEKDEMAEMGLRIDNPAFLALGNLTSATTNIPLDRAIKKAQNVNNALSKDSEIWQKIALIAGWSDWELGMNKKDKKKKGETIRINRGEDSKAKRKVIKINRD